VNELFTPSNAITALLGLLVTLLGWVFNRHVERTDARLDGLDEQLKESVTRAELDKTITQMREDRLRMHEENREDLHYIRERIDVMSNRP
jgi:hypothetical protein